MLRCADYRLTRETGEPAGRLLVQIISPITSQTIQYVRRRSKNVPVGGAGAQAGDLLKFSSGYRT